MSESTEIRVHLRPGGGRDELIGMRDGALQARVSAPPVDGKANRALCRLIAKQLAMAPSNVTVVRGEKSRKKLLRIEEVDPAALKRVLSTFR